MYVSKNDNIFRYPIVIKHSMSDLAQDVFGSLLKSKFDIPPGLRAGLDKKEPLFLRPEFCFLGWNLAELPVLFTHIHLIPDQDAGEVWIRVLPDVSEPHLRIDETLMRGHIIHEYASCSTAIIGTCD